MLKDVTDFGNVGCVGVKSDIQRRWPLILGLGFGCKVWGSGSRGISSSQRAACANKKPIARDNSKTYVQ